MPTMPSVTFVLTLNVLGCMVGSIGGGSIVLSLWLRVEVRFSDLDWKKGGKLDWCGEVEF